ncbi:hypothetical protein ZWY2020_023074 [Hordeum vulgare]|nr:hypothetical protein ZWY2020_023074 [Hordeum vulgare]
MEHGHATNRVDEYGNPVAGHGVGTGMGAHGGVGTGAAAGGHFQPTREEHKAGGILQRSGSSSSSSSEDDGMGGRRKKGLKDKIKEKLPGGHGPRERLAGAGVLHRQLRRVEGRRRAQHLGRLDRAGLLSGELTREKASFWTYEGGREQVRSPAAVAADDQDAPTAPAPATAAGGRGGGDGGGEAERGAARRHYWESRINSKLLLAVASRSRLLLLLLRPAGRRSSLPSSSGGWWCRVKKVGSPVKSAGTLSLEREENQPFPLGSGERAKKWRNTAVAAVSTELVVDPHSLFLSDTVDESSLTDVDDDHGRWKNGDWRGADPAWCCDDDRCILAPRGTLLCSAPFLLLGCRSSTSATARCLGALWDRALALECCDHDGRGLGGDVWWG